MSWIVCLLLVLEALAAPLAFDLVWFGAQLAILAGLLLGRRRYRRGSQPLLSVVPRSHPLASPEQDGPSLRRAA